MALDRGSRTAAAPARLPAGARIAAVRSRYHGELTAGMLASARDTLAAAGLAEGDLLAIDAPGAFELPVLAQRLASRDDVDAVLCFGLVLKGETEHDLYVADSVAHALQDVALAARKPVLFGVLTCRTLEQAEARARRAEEGGLDKGREVALAAIEALAALDAAGAPFGAGRRRA